MKKHALCILLLLLIGLLSAQPTKNPTRAALYSAFVPGGGQLYNHAYFKAGLVIGVQGYFIGSALYHDAKADDYKQQLEGLSDPLTIQQIRAKQKEYQDLRTSDFWWMGITMTLSVLDAWVDAHLYDFDAQKEKLHLRFEGDTLLLEKRF
ncbi:MAG: DUF5683 domain-containing protein [Candidatus Cloacimonas sp.]|nr:DUF5683 domain-containing protein [Candidatus Cloacimonas sp.]